MKLGGGRGETLYCLEGEELCKAALDPEGETRNVGADSPQRGNLKSCKGQTRPGVGSKPGPS